jgi:hypothetical protein
MVICIRDCLDALIDLATWSCRLSAHHLKNSYSDCFFSISMKLLARFLRIKGITKIVKKGVQNEVF